MTKLSRAFILALLLAVAGCSDDTPAGTESDLRAELSKLRDQIAEANDTARRYKGGQIGEMAALRREVLLLSAALLENRLIADAGGVPSKVVVPALTSNPARAKQLLRHISAAEKALEQAKEKTAEREGVAGNLAQTTVVTQELTLAQLHLAFYQAAFGLALTGGPLAEAQTPDSTASTRDAGPVETLLSAREEAITEPLSEPGGNAETAAGGAQGSGKESPAATPNPEAEGLDVSALTESVEKDRPKSAGTDSEKDAPQAEAVTAPPPAPVERPAEPATVSYGREDTLRIQLLLQEAGFNPGTIDGRWGPQTRRAMAEFQRAAGLSASGRPDPTTLDMLGFN